MIRFPTLACFALGLFWITAAVADAGPERLALEPCTLPGLDEEVRCGTYEVFENRAEKKGRKIALRVVVLPATGGAATTDPVIFFAGGPGASTVESAPGLAAFLREARKERDFLLVDYRGTGESGPLFCAYQQSSRGPQDALETFMPLGELEACHDALSANADLAQYTTPNIVDDIDEVRAALGYAHVNLIGASYGSRAALVYLRRHPDTVRTAIIEGVVPTDADMPETFARDAQEAFDGLVRECAEDAACHAAFPDPAGDLRAILAHVDKTPPSIEVRDARSGDSVTLRMTRPVVAQTIRYMLYQVPGSLQLPAFLRAAATGDYDSLAQNAYSVAGALMTSLPDGLYLSVTCAEDVPFIDVETATAEARGTFLGDFRLRAQLGACEKWTRASLPEGYRQPVTSKKPVLIISGERDPVTPARWGDQAARHLPNSRHLVVADAAHSYFGLEGTECIDALVVETLRRGRVDTLDLDACAKATSRHDFLLETAKDTEIELDAAALARFAGTYTAPGGISFEAVMVDGVLRGRLFGLDLALTPVGPLRFRPEGAPPGTYIVFTEAEGKIGGVELRRAGASPQALVRKE